MSLSFTRLRFAELDSLFYYTFLLVGLFTSTTAPRAFDDTLESRDLSEPRLFTESCDPVVLSLEALRVGERLISQLIVALFLSYFAFKSGTFN